MSNLRIRFSTLEAIGHAIASSAPVDKLLELVMDMLLQAVPSEGATIFLKEPPDDMLRFAVTRGPTSEALEDVRLRSDEGIAGWVVQNNRYALVSDAASDARFSKRVDEQTGFETRSLLCVPLRTRHGVVGAIELINPLHAKFTKDDAEYVTSIANQTAHLIENVLMYQGRRQYLAALKALQTASQWLNSSLHIEEVLGKIVETADDVIKAEAGSILLMDDEGQLDFTVALGPVADKLMEHREMLRERLKEGIGPWVAKTGKPELIRDCSKDPRFASGAGPEIREKLGFETRSLLCVPMRARGEVVGVVQLVNRLDGEPFDMGDLSTLSVFADNAAAALTNAKLYESLEESYRHTINSLATALDLRDNETGGHSQRVALLAREVAQRLGLGKDEIDDVYQGALLHDIGKIGVPDRILLKPGKLTDAEWETMRRHTVGGYRLLEGIDFLERASVIPLFHHERYDGKGYMAGLKGEDIPLGARIFAIIDTYDAMTSDRPYRKAMPHEVACEEIRESCGTQLDPEVVEVFLSITAETIDGIGKRMAEQVAADQSGQVEDGDEAECVRIARQAYRRLKVAEAI